MRAGIKPEIVIATAADIADRIGWEQITLANVAGQLGIKTPSLYNHVEGLPDLRQKLAVYASRQLLDQLQDAAIGHSGKEALIEVGQAYVLFVRQHPGLYESINRIPDPKPAPFEQTAEGILNLFIRLMQPLGIPPEEAVHAIRGLRSLVHGFASLEAIGGFQMKEDLMESLSKSITYYIDGLSRQFN
ncbi:TetR-like C-terminal domain-containing protein [Cohnella cholangitidis]|uniref:TetR/AcrR family transcriptional regulator n=1 Tax=Cohnella cholangitidis TaxID=2598458 RepID=A0A7G5BUC8_9BACL|nr:TetR-like C-terminal domain-containing protein [Cohnella cholangitidis]QMV40562.1 TetR/AcrR family transcriptional regulator [Cohnella cholangitidis]